MCRTIGPLRSVLGGTQGIIREITKRSLNTQGHGTDGGDGGILRVCCPQWIIGISSLCKKEKIDNRKLTRFETYGMPYLPTGSLILALIPVPGADDAPAMKNSPVSVSIWLINPVIMRALA